MGREVKRVALDFDWPLNKIWSGYLMPERLHSMPCKACDNSGLNPSTKEISDDFYAFSNPGRRWCEDITQDEVDALVAAGRLMDYTHTWTRGTGWKPDPSKPHPTAAQVNANQAGMAGHDAINRWVLIETRAKRLGVYGKCGVCHGEGHLFANDQHKQEHEDWSQTDPPSGDGYQMWENTSEGSPISPVFATPEELATWLEKTNASSFGSSGATYEQWLSMIKGPAWAPSAVLEGGVLKSGVEAMS